MLDPPNLDETTITTALQFHYGISTSDLTFLPIGHDSSSWVYRIQAIDGQSYFLKLRARHGFSPSSLAIPKYLQEQGLPHILAPLPAIDQALWVSVHDFALSLYHFIEGQLAADVGLSEQQWPAFGALIKQIHSCQLPVDLLPLVPQETFVPSRRHLIEELEAAAARSTFNSAEERELAEFWNAHRDVIGEIVDHSDSLADQLRRTSAPRVLCHADMHTWNVLLGSDDQLWLIDWDEVILALKERDLMFIAGGIGGDGVGPQETDWFLQGYGEPAIDPKALAYYRYAWAVQDMAADGEQVFFAPDSSQRARSAAVRAFMNLFEPGQIVEIASRSTGGTR